MLEYEDSIEAAGMRYEAELEWRREAAEEEAFRQVADEAFEAQQTDPLRAVCLRHDDDRDGCRIPSVEDREDEIPF